ncbi:MAG: hypothetical protein CMJ36_01245 [Phycisphaerae bacterium]|nr:hypothetical protein [Phycisphaerae bacterium]
MMPADVNHRLDEHAFVDAVLDLQKTVPLPDVPEKAWEQLLTAAYDLAFAYLHDQHLDHEPGCSNPVASRFLETVFSEDGPALDETGLATLHETVLERTPVYDRSGCLEAMERDRGRRERMGAFYTPDHVVDSLLERSLDPLLDIAEQQDDPVRAMLQLRICDPACGSGHFLVRAGERLAQRAAKYVHERDVHWVRVNAFRDCLYGAELDPVSAHVCKRRLWSLAADSQLCPSSFDQRILAGHGLLGALPGTGTLAECDAWTAERLDEETVEALKPVHWHLLVEDGFDLVIGNPPFMNQLARDTSMDRRLATLLRDRFGDVVKGYPDVANIFLRLAADLVRPGGRIALLQPWSVLSSRDAGGIRRDLARRLRMTDLWVALEHIFDAGVHVCAPVLERTMERKGVLHRTSGAGFEPAEDIQLDMDVLADEDTWSGLVSDLMGIPRIDVSRHETLDRIATATADFRDQYYGLRGCVQDALHERPSANCVPLITTGLVDPATCRWGRKVTRYDGRRWNRPQVNLQELAARTELEPWATSRLVPKLLLATQTKVLEVYVDEDGACLPLTPLITIMPLDPGMLWHLAAALASPVCTALAAGRYLGAARSTNAIKLSASQALTLPMPTVQDQWDAAASAFQAASAAGDDAVRLDHLHEAAMASCLAYGCGKERSKMLLDWWKDRLPR